MNPQVDEPGRPLNAERRDSRYHEISMALIAVSGQTGCRVEEVARISAQRLGFQLVAPSRVRSLIEREFGSDPIPDKAYADVLASIVARLATEHHLILAIDGAELLIRRFPGMLR